MMINKNVISLMSLLALIDGSYVVASDHSLYETIKKKILSRDFAVCRYIGSIINAATLAEADSFLRIPRRRYSPDVLDATIIRQAALKHKTMTLAIGKESIRPDQAKKIENILTDLPNMQSPELERNPNMGIRSISIQRDKYNNNMVQVESTFRVIDGDNDENSQFYRKYIYDNENSSPFYQLKVSACTKCKPYGNSGLIDCITKTEIDSALTILQDLITEKTSSKK